jgi:hypothetical protein
MGIEVQASPGKKLARNKLEMVLYGCNPSHSGDEAGESLS